MNPHTATESSTIETALAEAIGTEELPNHLIALANLCSLLCKFGDDGEMDSMYDTFRSAWQRELYGFSNAVLLFQPSKSRPSLWTPQELAASTGFADFCAKHAVTISLLQRALENFYDANSIVHRTPLPGQRLYAALDSAVDDSIGRHLAEGKISADEWSRLARMIYGYGMYFRGGIEVLDRLMNRASSLIVSQRSTPQGEPLSERVEQPPQVEELENLAGMPAFHVLCARYSSVIGSLRSAILGDLRLEPVDTYIPDIATIIELDRARGRVLSL